MKTLIVSEKNIAARRIAEMLSKGKSAAKKLGGLSTYHFQRNGEEVTCIGLKGHILKVDFPPEYANWQDVDPAALIDAKLIKVPTQKSLVNLLKKEGKQANKVIVATDFDREGELIGIDALNQIKEVNPVIEVKRARFSALTNKEVDRAFSYLEDPYYSLAEAGEARQDIDLIWGATLTRFLSLTSTRLGRQFLSVGRVQSPTLAIVVKREHERQAFKPEPYWQLKGLFRYEQQDYEAIHKTEKFWQKDEVDAVLARLGDQGVITEVKKTERLIDSPAPFNTTAFLAAAAAAGISPARAMRIAENLYMEGFISYPRVDNTVYPPSLEIREILSALKAVEELSGLVHEINVQPELKPTRGKKQATDHPPIHPTAAATKEQLGANWKIYELVVRRFLATLAPPAKVAGIRVDIDVDGESFFIRGSRTITPGWLHFYPYGKKKDDLIPDVNQGDQMRLIKKIVEEKETQPPGRYSQGSLIQKMEELGLGTKATRHTIIQNLYDRGYIHSDPIVPTDLGTAVCEALSKHAGRITSPDMTSELESEMDKIAEGELERDQVVERSRQMLAQTLMDLAANKEKVGQEIRAGILEGQILGKCPNSGGDLRIIRSKRTRKRFIGCSDYPDCSTTYPLPQYGDIIPLGEICEECGSPKIKVINKGKRPWIICIDPTCQTKAEYNNNKTAKK